MTQTTPRLICVGDLHGHMAELMGLMHTLYTQADFQPERDTLVQYLVIAWTGVLIPKKSSNGAWKCPAATRTGSSSKATTAT